MKRIHIVALYVLVLMLNGCNYEPTDNNLRNVLESIDKIETATYHSRHYACYPGDTIPMGERNNYYKEFIQPSDTSVGAYYIRFDMRDSTRMLFAYDGNVRARINWDDYHYDTDDFSNNPWPYRAVMAPFFSKVKALIEYTFITSDSIQVDSTDYGSTLVYKVQIFNERLELVGRLPIHVTELGSNEGVISEYNLWVDKESNLPFKFQRALPGNTLGEEIDNLMVNHLSIDNFNIANYIPEDMPRRTRGTNNEPNSLMNTIAPEWKLTDLRNDLYKLEDFSSNVFMINFASIHCGVCRLYVPFFNSLKEKYSEEDFSFVSLYNEEEKGRIENYIKENNMNYQVLLSSQELMNNYQVSLYPTFMFLDANKRIRKVLQGYRKGETDKQIEKIIKELL